MKIVKKDISYNFACGVLEANNVKVEEVKASPNGMRFGFYNKDGKMIASYDERNGTLKY